MLSTVCYDQIGRLLWQTGPNDSVFAMARDGSVAAWVDDKGDVCVVSAADGARLYDIPASMMTGIASPDSIAVSQDGLCICERNGDIGTCLWFPAGSSKAIDLGYYCAADLFADGKVCSEVTLWLPNAKGGENKLGIWEQHIHSISSR